MLSVLFLLAAPFAAIAGGGGSMLLVSVLCGLPLTASDLLMTAIYGSGSLVALGLLLRGGFERYAKSPRTQWETVDLLVGLAFVTAGLLGGLLFGGFGAWQQSTRLRQEMQERCVAEYGPYLSPTERSGCERALVQCRHDAQQHPEIPARGALVAPQDADLPSTPIARAEHRCMRRYFAEHPVRR